MTQHFNFSRSRTSIAIAAAAFAGALSCTPLWAADAKASSQKGADAQYLKDRADCEAGRTAEDRATCLKEAGAAQQERRRHTLDNSGSPQANAADRCKVLPTKDQADCLARVQGPTAPNQRVLSTGSVAGGGVLKETTTTTPGAVFVITPAPAPATPPASAPTT
ncbi:MAG: hypothetical protein ACXWCN_08980 [Caldimonas sp.]